MNNLTHTETITDTGDQKQYIIRSHRQLTEEEIGKAIRKRSLHRLLRSVKLPGYVGIYEVIEVNAADGWEDAE